MVSKEALVSIVLGVLILTLIFFLVKGRIKKVFTYFGKLEFKELSSCEAELDGSRKGDITAYASDCCWRLGVCGACRAELQADGVYTGNVKYEDFSPRKCNVYLNAEEPAVSSIVIEKGGKSHSYIWESYGEYKKSFLGCCLSPCGVVASALECCSSECFSDDIDGLRQKFGVLIPEGEHKQTLEEFLIAWCGNPNFKCLLCYKKCTEEGCSEEDTRWYVCEREVSEKVQVDLNCDGKKEEVDSGVISVNMWEEVDNKWICTPAGWEKIS